MAAREITANIYSVGIINWDLRVFDGVMPTPYGTSNNAYVVKGSEKTALIDSGEPSSETEFITNLMKLDLNSLDYIVCLHAEQDHSGLLPLLLDVFPMAKIVTGEVCKGLLISMHDLQEPDERFIVVGDGETLSLGDKTLKFHLAPNVHWPDTMFAEVVEDKVLFTSDFLGAHYASSELFSDDDCPQYLDAVKRYYSVIMMPFRGSVLEHLEKVKEINPVFIAPAHGPVLKTPAKVADLYADWASDKVRNKVVVAYVSMHGSTKQMAEFLTDSLVERGVPVSLYNLLETDSGILAPAVVDAGTIILAAPTMLYGPHPAAVNAAYLLRAVRPKAKYLGIIGSFGWHSVAVEYLSDMLSPLGADVLEPVYIKGVPDEDAIVKLHNLADVIAEKHREL
ncbi:MAG TPA: FprA family A-type flavoprotein [Methanocorpusculum sp.]|nr:FprA family A-type flavoprotein [Methanocorpusculum sp.]